jgi:hypothetical protein
MSSLTALGAKLGCLKVIGAKAAPASTSHAGSPRTPNVVQSSEHGNVRGRANFTNLPFALRTGRRSVE